MALDNLTMRDMIVTPVPKQTIALIATEQTITELSLRKRAKTFSIFNCDVSVHIFEKHLSLQRLHSFKIKPKLQVLKQGKVTHERLETRNT